MESYIMLDGKKIKISKETAQNLKDQFAPVTYKRGDFFKNSYGCLYMIGRQEKANELAFISLNGGNRWSDIVTVGDFDKITEKELKKMSGSDSFTKVDLEITKEEI